MTELHRSLVDGLRCKQTWCRSVESCDDLLLHQGLTFSPNATTTTAPLSLPQYQLSFVSICQNGRLATRNRKLRPREAQRQGQAGASSVPCQRVAKIADPVPNTCANRDLLEKVCHGLHSRIQAGQWRGEMSSKLRRQVFGRQLLDHEAPEQHALWLR